MKKGMIIGIIAAVVVIAVVVGLVLMCLAPSMPAADGTYVAESGTTAVISGNTITCEEKGFSSTFKKVGFSTEYFGARLSGDKYVIYTLDTNLGDQTDFAIHQEGNPVKTFLGLYNTPFYLAN